MDENRVATLLHIVKEAAGHPTKLKSLGAIAMKELEHHDADAKKDLEVLLAEEAEEAAKAKAEADAKAKKIADEEAKKAELIAKAQEPTARRREVPEEVA